MAPSRRASANTAKEKPSDQAKKTKSSLDEHPLLQACDPEKPDELPANGELLWVRVEGRKYGYWPAFRCILQDRDDLEVDPDESPVDESLVTYVIFLEENFRFAGAYWDNIIPFKDCEEQKLLIPKLNKSRVYSKWKASKGFKHSIDLLEEFKKIQQSKRQQHAEFLFQNKKVVGKASPKKKPTTGTTSGVLASGSADQPTTNVDEINHSVLSETLANKRKMGLRVSDRIANNALEKQKSENNKKNETCKTDASSSSDSSGSTPPKPKVSKPTNKDVRPNVGGSVLKNWTQERFETKTRQFTLGPGKAVSCLKCSLEIEAGDLKLCHGMPYHANCLVKKDGDPNYLKCSMCINQLCYLCGGSSEEKKIAYKCTRCDLRFHVDCLKDWPQAEIFGKYGPLICPAHYCHTCMGEQRTQNKMRDYTVAPSRSVKCVKCLSTYHKACVPAGCAEDMQGKDFIVCPKHNLTKLKVHQRRIGCLICLKAMTSKGVSISCSLCVQIFHPQCIGYDDEIEKRLTLDEFGKDYNCFDCRWGLFPLYGQVIWFQQPSSSYWPARILYPGEASTRVANRASGQYSVEYFGETTFYDNASRGIPLHLTSIDIFKKMNVYKHGNTKAAERLLRAHEEASYFLQFQEDYREKHLPPPRPVYKRIEKNVYRTKAPEKIREPNDRCTCATDDPTSEFVCLPDSGCSNRDMEMECTDRNCSSGERCANRMFSGRKNDAEYLQEVLMPKKGWGVVASKVFNPGDFVAEYRGEVISKDEKLRRQGLKDEEDPMYILEISTEFFIDAEYYGNMSRLINHSCDPNCEIRKYLSKGLPVGGIFAKRRIQIGEELSFDYAFGKQSTAPFRCRCGAKKCAIFIGKDIPKGYKVEEDNDQTNDRWEETCSSCGYGGNVICCDYAGCGKVWHHKCVKVTRTPVEFWICPLHDKKVEKRKSVVTKSPTSKSVIDVETTQSKSSPEKPLVFKFKKAKSMSGLETPKSTAVYQKVSGLKRGRDDASITPDEVASTFFSPTLSEKIIPAQPAVVVDPPTKKRRRELRNTSAEKSNTDPKKLPFADCGNLSGKSKRLNRHPRSED